MARNVLAIVLVMVLLGAALWMVRRQEQPARPVGAPLTIAAPLGLPAVPVPADNPVTSDTVTLGRRLYYDTRLSVDSTVSCVSCHDPRYGFADPKPVSEGVQKKRGGRNSPTVFNAAYYDVQFWDGRAPTLEKQAEGPVENPVEMAHTLKGVEERLNADPTYKAQFERAFGPGPIYHLRKSREGHRLV